MAVICTLEGWLNVVEGNLGFKGVSSSREVLLCRGSVIRSQAGIQLVGKSDVEE